ncbi:hypothetical protein [Kribbella sp. NBC_00889]|uniref:hypothetical protein n=1 Tax=Kribbella sp. NBC_00889 TaxID=2975974 RepID=UPI0038670F36|nr:hypothetical protein OG817_09065 [Kribbella sp. NBC_00889]
MSAIRELPRVVPAEPAEPVRKEAAASQQASLNLAVDRSSWSQDQADEARTGRRAFRIRCPAGRT